MTSDAVIREACKILNGSCSCKTGCCDAWRKSHSVTPNSTAANIVQREKRCMEIGRIGLYSHEARRIDIPPALPAKYPF